MMRAIRGALLIVLALALYLCALAPTLGIAAPIFAVIVYAVVAYYGVGTVGAADPAIVRAIAGCGILFAIAFVPSILIEYFGRTVNNTILLGVVATCCNSVKSSVLQW